jgi:hypothetical protein
MYFVHVKFYFGAVADGALGTVPSCGRQQNCDGQTTLESHEDTQIIETACEKMVSFA